MLSYLILYNHLSCTQYGGGAEAYRRGTSWTSCRLMFKMRDPCASERKRIPSLLVRTAGKSVFCSHLFKGRLKEVFPRSDCSASSFFFFFLQPMFMVFVYFFPSAVLEFIFFCYPQLSHFISACALLWKSVGGCRGRGWGLQRLFCWLLFSLSLFSTTYPPHSLLQHSFAMPFHPLPSFCWAPFELFKSGLERCSIPFKKVHKTQPLDCLAWLKKGKKKWLWGSHVVDSLRISMLQMNKPCVK